MNWSQVSNSEDNALSGVTIERGFLVIALIKRHNQSPRYTQNKNTFLAKNKWEWILQVHCIKNTRQCPGLGMNTVGICYSFAIIALQHNRGARCSESVSVTLSPLPPFYPAAESKQMVGLAWTQRGYLIHANRVVVFIKEPCHTFPGPCSGRLHSWAFQEVWRLLCGSACLLEISYQNASSVFLWLSGTISYSW